MMCLMRMNTLQQAPCNLRLSFQSEIAVVSNEVLDSNTTYLEGNTRKLLQFNCFPENIVSSCFLQLSPKQFLLRTGKIKGCEQWVT